MKELYKSIKEFIKENECLVIHIIQELEQEREEEHEEQEEHEINVDKNVKVFGYARVSSRRQAVDGNSLEAQEKSIYEAYPEAEVYSEAVSGLSNNETLLNIIDRMSRGDILVVTRVDRFSRSVLLGTLYFNLLTSKGCILHVLNAGQFTDNPCNRMTFINLLNVAEFDRIMTLDKTMAGKRIARTKEGYREGRPKEFSTDELNEAYKMLGWKTYTEVSNETGISVSTLTRYRRLKIEEEKRILAEQHLGEGDDYIDIKDI